MTEQAKEQTQELSAEEKHKQSVVNALVNTHFHVTRLYKIIEILMKDNKEAVKELQDKQKEIEEQCLEAVKKAFDGIDIVKNTQ